MFVAFYQPCRNTIGNWLIVTETPPTNCVLMSEGAEPIMHVAGDWKQSLLKIEAISCSSLGFQAPIFEMRSGSEMADSHSPSTTVGS